MGLHAALDKSAGAFVGGVQVHGPNLTASLVAPAHVSADTLELLLSAWLKAVHEPPE
jgi:hypothetical protein